MALTYKNVATIINQQIMKNATGDNEGTIIAEDLSNLVDVLKVVNSASVPDMRNAVNNLIVGIHNYVIDRLIETNTFKMLRDSVAYGGAIQRIMQSGLFDAQESHILNLQNGVSYLDGKFYGSDPSAAVQELTATFKVVHSVADDFYSTWFNNAEDLVKWANSVALKERNTIRKEVAELEKRVINKAIVTVASGNRKVQLLTMFNAMEGRTVNPSAQAPATLTNNVKWTLTELQKYRDEWAYFGSFCKSVVARLVDYVKNPNKKYNDGTVLTWAPSEVIGVVMLSQFANEIEYLGTPVEYSSKSFIVDYSTVDTWQNIGTAMLPDYATTATIKETAADDQTVTVNNVVGFIYDIDGVGVINVLSKPTYEDVGAEGFGNIHNHQANRYFVDKRLSGVVITLD